MDFLKKHYEKLILGVVLLGLAGAVAFLPIEISSERQKLEDLTRTIIKRKIPPLTNLDLTIQENALKRMAVPALHPWNRVKKLIARSKIQQRRNRHSLQCVFLDRQIQIRQRRDFSFDDRPR